jgi:hypothetical protein
MTFDPQQMPRTDRYSIRYPGQNDLVKYASQQFKAMAESIDDNIDHLPDRVTSAIATATATASQAAARAEAAANKIGRQGDQIVVIGDSYAAGYQDGGSRLGENQRIPYWIGQTLGMTVHSYAVDGAGFVAKGTDGKTYDGQADRAIADTSYDHKRVAHVIICGDRNDGNGGDNISIGDSASRLFVKLLAEYPNAQIWVAYLWDNREIFKVGDQICYSWLANSVTYFTRTHFIAEAPSWGVGQDWWYGSGIHPNASGAQHLGGHIAAAIQGSTWPGSGLYKLQLLNGVTGKINFTVLGTGMGLLYGKFTCPNELGAQVDIAQGLPVQATVGDNFVPMVNNGGENIVLLHCYQGKLTTIARLYTGSIGRGNCWITPTIVPVAMSPTIF